jgi:hypothetical protein
MFEKIKLDVATVYKMYPSLIQQQHVDQVRDLLDRKKVDKYKNKDKKETSYDNEIKYSRDCVKDGKCILITIN